MRDANNKKNLMMKQLVLLLFCVLSFSAICQTEQTKNNYQLGMTKAFELWKNDKPWEAVNIFERIARAQPDNWLPPFYVAQVIVLNSFNEKDKEKITKQLGKARNFLNDAKALSKDNPEIMVVEAQWYTAWVAFDGMQYGMKYSAKIEAIYKKASLLAPDNPRVVLGKTEWSMGMAQYFGQDISNYCPELARAVALFDTFVPEYEFSPIGGKEYAKSVVLKTCKKQ
jgi:tetratricopeptide (TPR) repeat protein